MSLIRKEDLSLFFDSTTYVPACFLNSGLDFQTIKITLNAFFSYFVVLFISACISIVSIVLFKINKLSRVFSFHYSFQLLLLFKDDLTKHYIFLYSSRGQLNVCISISQSTSVFVLFSFSLGPGIPGDDT